MNVQKLVFSFAAILFFSLNGFAQPSTGASTFPEPSQVDSRAAAKAHVGFLAGMNSLDGSGYENASNLGLEIGLQPYIPYALGAEINYSKNSGKKNNSDLERLTALLKGTYNFGGANALLSKSYVGLATGAIFANDSRRTDVVLGPLVGFDFPMLIHSSDMVSIGVQVKYLVTSGSEPDTLLASAAFKYWF